MNAASPNAPKVAIKLTANFERNLEDIERFLAEANASHAFDALLDELTDTVILNLERFPTMGRDFLSHPVRSVEASNRLDELQGQLVKIGENAEVREYVLQHYLMLYAYVGEMAYLLSIRHHKQLSFDFDALWGDT